MSSFSLLEGTSSWQGGDRLTLAVPASAALPLTSLVAMFEGAPDGAANSGLSGGGPVPVVLGQATAFLPPLPVAAASCDLRLTDAAGDTQDAQLPVYAPLYGSYTFALRAYLPITWATGPRSVAELPLPAATSAQPSLFAALTSALAEGLNLMGGVPLSRLTAKASAGDATLQVERTAALPAPGTVEVDGVTYAYASLDPAGSLGGISVTRGGAQVAGVQATHLAGAQVAYTSGPVSDVATLRDSFFLDTAVGPDLTALGRNLGVLHSPAVSGDDQYRAIIKAVAYGPKTSLYGIQLALDAILGAGNYTLAEDPVGAPCQVQIALSYASVADTSGVGVAYIGGTQTVAPDSDGTLPLAGPSLGFGSVWADAAGTPDTSQDLSVLTGTNAATATAGTLTFGTQTVPAPTVTLPFAALPSDLGGLLDLTGGAQPGRYTITEVTGPDTVAVHQGSHAGVTLATVGGRNLVTIPLAAPDTAEATGAFLYPQDLSRQVCVYTSAQGNTGSRNILTILDAGTGADLAQLATPLAQRGVTCVVDGAPFVTETAAEVVVLPDFPSASGVAYRMARGYVATTTTQGASLVRRVALQGPPAAYDVDNSDVLSAYVTRDASDTVSVLPTSPPSLSESALYIDAPFGALEAYLSDLTAAGVQPVLAFS